MHCLTLSKQRHNGMCLVLPPILLVALQPRGLMCATTLLHLHQAICVREFYPELIASYAQLRLLYG